MSPKPNVSAERKPQILAAAMRTFTRKGLVATRMEDIAREARLSVGGVYWYFLGKDEVILELLEEMTETDIGLLRELLEADGSVVERLLKYLQTDLASMLKIYPLLYQLYAFALHDARILKHVSAYRVTYRQTLVEFFQQGIERGELRPHDVQVAASTLTALAQGVLETAVLDPAHVDFVKTIRETAGLFLSGLAAVKSIEI